MTTTRIRQYKKRYPGCFLEKKKQNSTDGIFYVKYKKPNTQKYCTAKFGRKTLDRTWSKCNRFRMQLINGEVISGKEVRAQQRKTAGLTLEVMAEKYFNHYDTDTNMLNKVKAGHRTDSLNLNNHLLPFFGTKDITKLSKADVLAFREHINQATMKSGKHYSDQSKKHFMGLLQRILNFNDVLFSSVFWKQATPRVVKRKHKKGYLTPEELNSLLHVLDSSPSSPIIRLTRILLTWGCRASELTRLRWRDVDLKGKKVLFSNRKNGAPDLQLTMDTDLAGVFKEQRGRTLPHPEKLVFPAKNGGIRITSSISRPVRKLLDKAGIPGDFKPLHGFRDNAAFQIAHDVDGGLEVASKMLGHSSIKTTQGYIETIEDGNIRGVSILSRMKG